MNNPDFDTDNTLPYEVRDGALINYKDPSPGGDNVSVPPGCDQKMADLSPVWALLKIIFRLRDSSLPLSTKGEFTQPRNHFLPYPTDRLEKH